LQVVKGWELLVAELRTSMSNRRDTSQRDYVVTIGERKVNLRELDHRVEIEVWIVFLSCSLDVPFMVPLSHRCWS
jgi:hypothetical protein